MFLWESYFASADDDVCNPSYHDERRHDNGVTHSALAPNFTVLDNILSISASFWTLSCNLKKTFCLHRCGVCFEVWICNIKTRPGHRTLWCSWLLLQARLDTTLLSRSPRLKDEKRWLMSFPQYKESFLYTVWVFSKSQPFRVVLFWIVLKICENVGIRWVKMSDPTFLRVFFHFYASDSDIFTHFQNKLGCGETIP